MDIYMHLWYFAFSSLMYSFFTIKVAWNILNIWKYLEYHCETQRFYVKSYFFPWNVETNLYQPYFQGKREKNQQKNPNKTQSN